MYDRGTGSWSALPRDPLSTADARQVLFSGGRLIALACSLAERNDGPCLVRAAAFDFATGAWQRLPDSQVQFHGLWFATDDRLVNPTLGASDGGQTNPWDHAYPNGGIFDLVTGMWSALPNPPSANEADGTGVLTATGAYYGASRGWVLDTTTNTWVHIRAQRRLRAISGSTVVAAGRRLFVFGGATWKRERYRVVDDAWTWTPPRPG